MRDGGLYFLHQGIAQRVADEVFARQQDDVAGRFGYGKGTYQLLLCLAELQHGQLGNEGDAFPALDHAHEGLHTAQMVGKLAGLCRLQLAETHQLVAEAVAFVEQPELFAAEVGRTYQRMAAEVAFARYVGIKLFVEEACLLVFLHACQTGHNTCVDASLAQGTLDVCGLHLRHPYVQSVVLLHQLREEAGQQVGGNSR